MTEITWKVDTKEVEEKLMKAAKMYGADAVEEITEGGANIIKEEAEERAPRGTEPIPQKSNRVRLHKAMVVKRLDRRMGRAAPHIAGVDRKKAFHAWWVEYGTSKMSKQPYFRPAVEAKRQEVARHLRDGLRRLTEGFR